jgi:arylsulfatase
MRGSLELLACTALLALAVGPAPASEPGRDLHTAAPPEYLRAPRPPAGSPNVLIILADDLGYSDLGAYGSEIETPNIDALAARGLRYRDFTVTGICSPTRAALLTGMNHHQVGTGWLAEMDFGYPGYRGEPTRAAPMLAEILGDAGWATLMVGKWHLTNQVNRGRMGPHDSWPTGRGFQRYFGFLDGETGQFFPLNLIRGSEHVDYPTDGSFYLPDALTDEAIAMLRQLRVESERPFLLYYATGAPHAPHHTRPQDRAKYRGRYADGWDEIRSRRLARQLERGLVPPGTVLAPYSPEVVAWSSLSGDQRRMYARFQENYAAFVDSFDQNVGRLLAHLEKTGELDNTLVFLLSDNGASREVGPEGSWNTAAHFYHRIPGGNAENLEHFDEIGGSDTHPHYPRGWMQASNTPFTHGKRAMFAGGVNAPLIVSWPRRIAARGEVRSQFHHVTDILPTVLELVSVQRPELFEGRAVPPLAGASMAYSFADAAAPSRRREQYYEIEGQLAYTADGWKIATWREQDQRYDAVPWQLFDRRSDFSEARDVAREHPEKVAELEAKFWKAARENDVLPISDLPLLEVARRAPPSAASLRTRFVYRQGDPSVHPSVQPVLAGRAYEIRARVERPGGAEQGVLIARGSSETGWTLFVRDGRLIYENNLPRAGARIESRERVPRGASTLGFRFRPGGSGANPLAGSGVLLIDGREVGSAAIGLPISFTNEGLEVGRDEGTAVSKSYSAPFAFGGRIEEVIVELDPAAPPNQ